MGFVDNCFLGLPDFDALAVAAALEQLHGLGVHLSEL